MPTFVQCVRRARAALDERDRRYLRTQGIRVTILDSPPVGLITDMGLATGWVNTRRQFCLARLNCEQVAARKQRRRSDDFWLLLTDVVQKTLIGLVSLRRDNGR